MLESPEKTFTRRLRKERKAAGITQVTLAERLNELTGSAVDGTAITRIEQAKRSVRLDEAVAIAQVLGVSLNSLLSDESEADLKIGELRRDLSQARWRVMQAEDQLQQAQYDVTVMEREIAELKASRSE